MAAHESVVVAAIPSCDVCRLEGVMDRPAYADARTPHGQWGYLCKDHFDAFGCSLGLGRGQRLVLRGES